MGQGAREAGFRDRPVIRRQLHAFPKMGSPNLVELSYQATITHETPSWASYSTSERYRSAKKISQATLQTYTYNNPEGNIVARLPGCQARHHDTYTLCVQVGHLTTISSLSVDGGTHAVIGELSWVKISCSLRAIVVTDTLNCILVAEAHLTPKQSMWPQGCAKTNSHSTLTIYEANVHGQIFWALQVSHWVA